MSHLHCRYILYSYHVHVEEERQRVCCTEKHKTFRRTKRKVAESNSNKEFLSSEESDGEDIIVHPIPWRSKVVNNMFNKIDARLKQNQSGQAKRQKRYAKVEVYHFVHALKVILLTFLLGQLNRNKFFLIVF